MAFGRRRGKDDSSTPAEPPEPADEAPEETLQEAGESEDLEASVAETAAAGEADEQLDEDPDEDLDEDLEGPFDIDDFDDPAVAVLARLDLGSVLIPMPEGGQLQVELTEAGVPSAVWVVTPNGRFTIAAYAAPKTGGLWREVAGELADSLRKDSAKVSIKDGPWGREVVGTASGVVRFIGVDGYRWMIRCVVNGPQETIDALNDEARAALADTVVRRGDTPLPVRTPLPVQLPEAMAEQLREAAAAQQPDAQQQSDQPAPRRGAEGSAMQQLRSTSTGG
jgi:Protein of unknown function (DUF3710)